MDVYFFDTQDGGDIECLNGVVTMDEGLYGATYISLQGGNEEDDGGDATEAQQFWGNVLEASEDRKIRSQFQAATLNHPLNSATLQIFEEAAAADLRWMIDGEIVDSADLSARIVSPKRLGLDGSLTVRTDTYPFSMGFPTR